MSRGIQLCTLLALAGLVCGAAAAGAAPGKLATPNAGPAGIEWRPVASDMGLVLTVSGPQGFYLRTEFAAGQAASFSVFDAAGALRPAGSYVYELRAVPHVDDATRAELQAARESGAEASVLGKAGRRALEVQSGAFAIAEGTILMGGESEPGAGKPAGSGGNRIAPKDQVIPDDLIVQGSACIGIDCVNNESFGFDTIRMKENNTRIDFTDTSSTAGFPTQDWEIAANDSASGGRNALIVSDEDNQIFVIESGIVSNALYVDDTGRVGLRTSSPVLDLHISTSNTPALRLEQTNAGGFTAQTWDVAGNEANFFVRDVTGGSKLSFRIRPGAPTSSIDIANDGDVGIGTGSPAERVHITGTDNPKILIEDITDNANDKPGFTLRSPAAASAGDWFFETDNAGNFQIDFGPSTGPEIVITDNTATNGAVTINGNLTVNGTFSNPSSRELKEGFEPVDAQEVLAKVAGLQIAEWTYKSDLDRRRHVGPTAEDFLATFGLGSDGKYLFPIDVQGVTMAAVQGLHQKVNQLETERDLLKAQTDDLQSRNAELNERLDRLEKLLDELK